jgi:hypothetical protein
MTKERIVYISGPMSGIENNNREAFYETERGLRGRKGALAIVNPARIGDMVDSLFKNVFRTEAHWEDYMRVCIRELSRATHIVYLPGWENSRGARLEHEIAVSLGIEAFDFDVDPDAAPRAPEGAEQ